MWGGLHLLYMKNTTLRNALVTLGSFILVVTVVGAWTAPTGAPPTNNVSAPINVSNVWQKKSGPMGVTALVSDSLVQVGGASAVTCNASFAGSIRWTGTAFEGCNGSAWVAFGGSWAVPPPPTNQPCPAGVDLKPDLVAHRTSCSFYHPNQEWMFSYGTQGGLTTNTAHGASLLLSMTAGPLPNLGITYYYLCSNGTYLFQSCYIAEA